MVISLMWWKQFLISEWSSYEFHESCFAYQKDNETGMVSSNWNSGMTCMKETMRKELSFYKDGLQNCWSGKKNFFE